MGAAVTATPVLRADEWPAYRGGPDRFGASATVVPAEVKPLWRKHVGSDLTPPVIAEGKVFVSSMDDYSVSALDATTGDVLWRFTASGRVDSPPTVDSGRVVFGCRDGWVYCLRVSDGVMVWRFRAAPAVERIVVDGRLESPWPVHGSVLIQDGIVYAAAGRHMNLDGGVTFYALDLKDGHIVWSRLFEKLPGDLNRTNTPVALLTADGNALYMGKRAFDAKTGTDAAYVSRGHIMDFGASGFLDNDWFEYDNTKNRLLWCQRDVSWQRPPRGRGDVSPLR
jgi:outer membrane protein assembly factor BamB